MDTIKTATKEYLIRDVMNTPPELLDFTVFGTGIAEAATIFADAEETKVMLATIGGKQYTFSGYTNLGMIRTRESGGIEIGLTRRATA